jgi:hypothetical protein
MISHKRWWDEFNVYEDAVAHQTKILGSLKADGYTLLTAGIDYYSPISKRWTASGSAEKDEER